MWIVDWEYSGMNDPMWDLGDLSVEGGFSPAQDEEMLSAYFNGKVRAADRGRMVIYKAMCDLLWTLWGLIQLANKNPADDFRTYADNRFARCRALIAQPDFARHVEPLRRRVLSQQMTEMAGEQLAAWIEPTGSDQAFRRLAEEIRSLLA